MADSAIPNTGAAIASRRVESRILEAGDDHGIRDVAMRLYQGERSLGGPRSGRVADQARGRMRRLHGEDLRHGQGVASRGGGDLLGVARVPGRIDQQQLHAVPSRLAHSAAPARRW
jgi:hypothetical protein